MEQPAPQPWSSLIPRPEAVSSSAGVFIITSATTLTIRPSDTALAPIAGMLANNLRASTGFEMPVAESESRGDIHLELDNDLSELGDEGYDLVVSGTGATIRAHAPAGIFYGTQTFRQMLPSRVELGTVQSGPWSLAAGTIRDRPRFVWRGFMLDVARHFFTADDVRRYIDVMSHYKMNRLHLHLTDDQGWRIQIDSWPTLTSIGGASQVGGGTGGFYTKSEYAALVDYAAERFVTVVPELDMPGHTRAALASVPELNCDGVPPEPYTGTSVGISSLCIGLPITETFVRDVIGEVAAMTPGPYLHVGGDEAKKTPEADYIAFMKMVRDIVAEHGKEMVAWEEIARAGLGTEVVAQHWFDEDLAVSAATSGSAILLSPATRTYLDMKYDLSSPPEIGTFWAGFIDVATAYDWDPGVWLDAVPEDQVLGVEAPVWTETIGEREELDWMVFPRLLGYAELAWSPSAGRDVQEYLGRLQAHGTRLDAMGIVYFPVPEMGNGN